MDKPSLFLRVCGRGALPALLASVLLVATVLTGVAPSQPGASSDDAMMKNLVQYFLRVGGEQYDRGFYIQAEETFLMAQGYDAYLDPLDKRKLQSMLEKTRTAAEARRDALQLKQAADELVAKGDLTQGKAQLETLKNSPYLTDKERMQIAETLDVIRQHLGGSDSIDAAPGAPIVPLPGQDAQLPGTTSRPGDTLDQFRLKTAALYYRSLAAYNNGDYEIAREGLTRVLKSGLYPDGMEQTLRGYLRQIDARLGTAPAGPVAPDPETTEGPPADVTVTAFDQAAAPDSQPTVIAPAGDPEQKRRIQQLFDQSWQAFSQGRLVEARAGFDQVAKSGLHDAPPGQRAEDYVMIIDKLLASHAQQPTVTPQPVVVAPQPQPLQPQPAPTQPSLLQQPTRPQPMLTAPSGPPTPTLAAPGQQAAQPAATDGSYISVINQRRSVIRSHVEAVVAGAIGEAQRLMAEGDLDTAKERILQAQALVNQQRIYLGDALFMR